MPSETAGRSGCLGSGMGTSVNAGATSVLDPPGRPQASPVRELLQLLNCARAARPVMETPVPPTEPPFHETKLGSTPLCDLGLTIPGTPLEPVIAEFRRELEAAGIRKLTPHFYLTTEWVVADDTIAIGIPFYLARP